MPMSRTMMVRVISRRRITLRRSPGGVPPPSPEPGEPAAPEDPEPEDPEDPGEPDEGGRRGTMWCSAAVMVGDPSRAAVRSGVRVAGPRGAAPGHSALRVPRVFRVVVAAWS